MADKDLRDAFFTREFQYGLGCIEAGEDFHLRAQLACIVEILLQDGAIVLRKGRLLHIDDIKFALEAVCVPAAAFQHLGRARLGGDADQDAFLHTPRPIHAMRSQIALELAVDYASGDEQRQFPEPGKLMPFREPRGAVCRGDSTREAIDGRGIHDHNLVRASIEKTAGNRAGGPLAGDAFHLFLELFEILQI